MTVLDASVYIALTNANEPGHRNSWDWFRSAIVKRESISTPVIILAEVAAAISRGVGDVALAHQTVELLLRSKSSPYIRFHLNWHRVRRRLLPIIVFAGVMQFTLPWRN